VTKRRGAWAEVGAASRVPHEPQSRYRAGFDVPQLGQLVVVGSLDTLTAGSVVVARAGLGYASGR